MTFTYPPLPPTDSLRLLRLHPGHRSEQLSGTLTAVPFSAKPRYLCLSYTWSDGSPGSNDRRRALRAFIDDDGPDMDDYGPFIFINGNSRFSIGRNLWQALLHLRSETTDCLLWVDQICINQADIPERNEQVTLMGFIYRRARAVISWLGLDIPEYQSSGHTESNRITLKNPILEEADGFKISRPDSRSAHGVVECGSTYFRRLWIVQEVCLAKHVVFLTGSILWSEQQVMNLVRDAARSGDRSDGDGGSDGPMARLMKTRAARFTPAMRLEALIEQFSHCGCSEIRDRVFGLASLAYDVVPVKAAVGSSSGAPGSATATMHPQRQLPGRGRGAVTIDYSQSYYNIWKGVVEFVLFRARAQLDFGKEPHELEDERRAKIVRFAGVLQNVFRNHVEAELQPPPPHLVEDDDEPTTPVLKGYIAGTILHLGPAYSDFVSSSHHHQLWTGSWDEHYAVDSDLTKLREMESTYEERIINYDNRELDRIACIDSPETVAWCPLRNAEPPVVFSSAFHDSEAEPSNHHRPPSCSGEPVRFLGNNHCMGLAPASARVGDVVVRFWNCNAAVVLRATNEEYPPPGEEYDGKRHILYGLIGRADIAEPYQRQDEYDHRAKDAMKIQEARYTDGKWVLLENRQVKTGAVYIRMGYKTLQRISSGLET